MPLLPLRLVVDYLGEISALSCCCGGVYLWVVRLFGVYKKMMLVTPFLHYYLVGLKEGKDVSRSQCDLLYGQRVVDYVCSSCSSLMRRCSIKQLVPLLILTGYYSEKTIHTYIHNTFVLERKKKKKKGWSVVGSEENFPFVSNERSAGLSS